MVSAHCDPVKWPGGSVPLHSPRTGAEIAADRKEACGRLTAPTVSVKGIELTGPVATASIAPQVPHLHGAARPWVAGSDR